MYKLLKRFAGMKEVDALKHLCEFCKDNKHLGTVSYSEVSSRQFLPFSSPALRRTKLPEEPSFYCVRMLLIVSMKEREKRTNVKAARSAHVKTKHGLFF